MYTLIVSIVLPNGNDPRPVATVVWPSGEIQRVTLHHDWSADMWDWRNGYTPTSFDRWFRDQFLTGSPKVHGARTAYTSPSDVGVDSNEAGRLMVYEVDYEG